MLEISRLILDFLKEKNAPYRITEPIKTPAAAQLPAALIGNRSKNWGLH
jgi:hypothetical protein